MDPNATFKLYVQAVLDGDLDAAAEATENYNEWVAKGGFMAKDCADDEVQKLDHEQDRYLALVDGDIGGRWRDVFKSYA